jgi:hypothetical protein
MNYYEIPKKKEIKKLKYLVKWGTYGKDGKEPFRYVRLIDCSSEHLVKIIENLHITGVCFNPAYVEIIKAILKDRKYDIPTSL